jgi:hypothetical protein
LLQSSSGRQQLSQTFNTCEPLKEKDVFYFKVQLAQTLGSSDQFQNPPQWPLNVTCGLMTSGNPITGWAQVMQQASGASSTSMRNSFPLMRGESGCLDMNPEHWIAAMKETTNQNRSWFWQKCTEFGFFQTSYNGTSPFFNIELELQVALCGEVFNIPNMEPDVDWTNAQYGGWNQASSNVIFANGLLDPWHTLSIYEPEGQVQAVTFNCGHCGNMIAPTDEDTPSLVNARKQIKTFLESVLDSTGTTTTTN